MIQVWKKSLLYGGELDGVATVTVKDIKFRFRAQGPADFCTHIERGTSSRSRGKYLLGANDDGVRRAGWE